MASTASPLPASIVASLLAGPIFLASLALAATYLQLPAPIVVSEYAVVSFLTFLPPAALVGFVLSFLPNVLGTTLMLLAARRHPLASAPEAWIGVGAAAGALLAIAVGAFPEIGFALVATSAACAGICRALVRLD